LSQSGLHPGKYKKTMPLLESHQSGHPHYFHHLDDRLGSFLAAGCGITRRIIDVSFFGRTDKWLEKIPPLLRSILKPPWKKKIFW